jgi:hypothetical protein
LGKLQPSWDRNNGEVFQPTFHEWRLRVSQWWFWKQRILRRRWRVLKRGRRRPRRRPPVKGEFFLKETFDRGF